MNKCFLKYKLHESPTVLTVFPIYLLQIFPLNSVLLFPKQNVVIIFTVKERNAKIYLGVSIADF